MYMLHKVSYAFTSVSVLAVDVGFYYCGPKSDSERDTILSYRQSEILTETVYNEVPQNNNALRSEFLKAITFHPTNDVSHAVLGEPIYEIENRLGCLEETISKFL